MAIDLAGNIYAIARWSGLRTQDVRARFGNPERLPTLKSAREKIAAIVSEKLIAFNSQSKKDYIEAQDRLQEQRRKLVAWQRHERALYQEIQAAPSIEEARVRTERFRKGLRAIWDRITGRHAATKALNEKEYRECQRRDVQEHESLVNQQLSDRRHIASMISAAQLEYENKLRKVREELAPQEPQHQFKTGPSINQGEKAKRTKKLGLSPKI